MLTAAAWSAAPAASAALDDSPAMGSMSSHDMHHHMALTAARPDHPGDRARADVVAAAARAAMKRWPDVAAVEAAGFKKFLPGVPLPIEHYTNDRYAAEAWGGTFNADHPTSMIFERRGSALTLVGVMYTAGPRIAENDLDAMVPLSVAQWHRHVDYCFPPAGTRNDGRFGFLGTVETKEACDAAGGRWTPQIFGWMVHVWPNERDPHAVWAVDAPK
ncbi:MAG: hypothetical protein ABR591_05070 [Candidatus Velthaea sp.]